MDVHGVKECSGAVKKCDERQSQGSVLIRLSTELSSQSPFQEFERRQVFFASEGDGPSFSDKAEVVRMVHKEVENAAASLHGSARGLDIREEIHAGAAAEERDKIILVGKALIESRGCGAASAGDGAHGEGIFAAFAPHAVCGIEDATFQTCIGLARHAATLPLNLARDYILYIVKDTMYKE